MKEYHKNKAEDYKKINKQNKTLGYIILYMVVFILIVIGEIILFKLNPDASLKDLFQDMIGNLMGVLAAFLVFDIVHEKISKDSYATEVSEQILDTIKGNPEVIDLYENSHKKEFINSFIKSVIEDDDATEMIGNYLDNYLLTKKDLSEEDVVPRDCRIRTAFSYNFILDTYRANAFNSLKPIEENGQDPYFYVQEQLDYSVKFLHEKGNNLNSSTVNIGLVFDNKSLDKALREGYKDNEFKKCIFRENLDLEEEDRVYMANAKAEELISMFRPHIILDGNKEKKVDANIVKENDTPFGIVFSFEVDYDISETQHDVRLIFHMPKRWDSILEACIVEPTKEPKISLSYNEDAMFVEMYPFLNKNDSSSYDNSLEEDNGVYSISISDEWVFPISGVVFFVKKKPNVRR